MKARNNVQNAYQFKTTHSKVYPYTTSYTQVLKPSYQDVLTIAADYTGPKDVTQIHTHDFTRSFTVHWTGRFEDETPSQVIIGTGQLDSFLRASEPGGGYCPAADFATLYNNCLSAVYDELRGGSADIANDVGEWRSTHNSVRSYQDSFIPLARVLGSRVDRFVKFVKSIHPQVWANRWLEYSYGWKPLVADIYEAADQLINHTTNSYVRISKRAKQVRVINTTYPGEFGGVVPAKVRLEFTTRVKMQAEFALRNTLLQQLSGFTSLNPANIAWELQPYSFVVDWFFDVGGYMRNLESYLLFGTDFKRGWYVEGYLCNYTGTALGQANVTSLETYFTEARASAMYSHKRRAPLVLLPRRPSLTVPTGWRRLISAASMLSQHVGHGKNSFS